MNTLEFLLVTCQRFFIRGNNGFLLVVTRNQNSSKLSGLLVIATYPWIRWSFCLWLAKDFLSEETMDFCWLSQEIKILATYQGFLAIATYLWIRWSFCLWLTKDFSSEELMNFTKFLLTKESNFSQVIRAFGNCHLSVNTLEFLLVTYQRIGNRFLLFDWIKPIVFTLMIFDLCVCW